MNPATLAVTPTLASPGRRDARFRQFLLAVTVDSRHGFGMRGADGFGPGLAHVYKGGGHQVTGLDRLYVSLGSSYGGLQ
jgi:hypothetical protein